MLPKKLRPFALLFFPSSSCCPPPLFLPFPPPSPAGRDPSSLLPGGPLRGSSSGGGSSCGGRPVARGRCTPAHPRSSAPGVVVVLVLIVSTKVGSISTKLYWGS